MYKVLITTSGTGSRLKGLTQNTNKSLVEVGGKKVIEYIIDQYNPLLELVITIGYFGDKVKKYVTQKYPERKITFVTVSPFEGTGSSLGYSMLQAKDYLQCPFVFHCNDTIVEKDIPSPEFTNWNGVSKGNDPAIFNTENYSSVLVKDSMVTALQMKGAEKFDSFHIGLVGIKDFEEFWKILGELYFKNPTDSTLNDCAAIIIMLQKGIIFKALNFDIWHDTGNLMSLENAQKSLKNNSI